MNARTASALLVLLVACEGKFGDRRDSPTTAKDGAIGDVCADIVCPADSQGSVESCRDWLDDPTCGGVAAEFFACFRANKVCRTDGTIDWAATFNACTSESARFQSCASSGG
jgi:hypothetical protein